MNAKAHRTLERYRKNPASCDKRKHQRFLKQFGFESRNGSKHIIYTHPENPILRFGLPYSKKISAAYVSDAIKQIDKLVIKDQTKNK